MKIGIGNDHSALELKAEIVEFLKEKGHEEVEYGRYKAENYDYLTKWEEFGPAVSQRAITHGIVRRGTGRRMLVGGDKM